MMLKSLFGWIIYHLPEGLLKNQLKCHFYNRYSQSNFHASYKNGYFQFDFKNGISFRCYDSIFYHLITGLEKYVAEYSLKEGDIVIDCGAHIGTFTLYAAKIVGDSGMVFAFEPDSLNYQKLIKNIDLNNLNNIIAIRKGLWGENTNLKFNELHSGYSSFFIDDLKRKSLIKVPVVSLDNELRKRGIKKVDFIKMDVEGAELEVIRGAKEILKKSQGNMAIASYHVIDGQETYVTLEKMLSKLGYQTKTLFPEHLITFTKKK